MKKTQVYVGIGVFAIGMEFLSLGCRPPSETSIVEERTVIKTYPFSDPNPVPILATGGMWGRGARIYPYFSFEGYSLYPEERTWTVVKMENPFVRVSVLPEVGGKIWGAEDKATGNPFIYTNHVLKFREIALRGPWTSGGIEFNFGVVGHAPSTATPVDYLVKENPDGSVSCVVGTTDWPSRTRWSVTIKLRPDRAYFETQAFWVNPTPFHQSAYSWMNAAVPASEDLQYVFPGLHHIGHDFTVPVKPWPVDEQGRDLSWYRNNAFGSSKSYFTVGEYEDFFGGYWHSKRFGFGHWALYDDMPGQKIWIWALSREGGIWEDLLTDADGQYSEPQAGRYFNQNDHGLFLPFGAQAWKEIWFSYRDIGPMVKASPAGVLHASWEGDVLDIGFFPLQRVEEDLEVRVGEKVFYRKPLVLDPAEVFKTSIPFAPSERHTVQIRIGPQLMYTTDPSANDLQRPIRFHPFDESTPEGLYLAARRLEQGRNFGDALQKYLQCLEGEPLHVRALCRTAELYCRRGEYEKALFYAHRALLTDMYDPEANYVYGVISRRMGRFLDALETLGWAARSLEYRSSAYAQMAEICFLEHNVDLALEYLERSLEFNQHNMSARLLKAIIFRKQSMRVEALRVLEKILEVDPLNHAARYEMYRLKRNPSALRAFQRMIRNEFPEETHLEISLFYVRLGLFKEAKELLGLVPEYPTACYWLAYLLRERDPQASQAWLDKARGLSPWLVFPFREESIPVLEWASLAAPEDWKPKYFLALILWSRGRVSEARDLLEACGNPEYGPFYLTRGHFYRTMDLSRARRDFERAVAIDPHSWRSWHTLIRFLNDQSLFPEALENARKAFQDWPEHVALRIDFIRALMGNGKYKEAADILESTVVLPYEGATGVHNLFVLCHVHLALEEMSRGAWEEASLHLKKAKTYPEHLGTGRPYEPDQRMQDFLLALCCDNLGNKEQADKLRENILAYTAEHGVRQNLHDYFAGWLLLQEGEERKARELMRRAKPPRDLLQKIRSILRSHR